MGHEPHGMTADEALRGWDRLWRELRCSAGVGGRRTRDLPTPACRERAEIVAEMLGHARRAFVRYEGQDAYRSAMWLRRLYLLERGETAGIYDGTDAVAWRRAYDAGKVGVVPAGWRTDG
jgi:hypothetical protein